MKKFYIIFILLVFLSGIFIIIYSTLKSRDAFSENLIISLSKNLENELTSYFEPLRNEFYGINEKYNYSTGEQMNEDSLASFLIPLIAGKPALGSILLYNEEGYLFNIYREKNTFVSSLEKESEDPAGLVWSRRDSENGIQSSWTEVLLGREVSREVSRNILDQIASDDESVLWTGIYYSRQLKEPVITAAVDWKSGVDSSIFICSMEMPVRLIIRHLQSFNKYKGRRIFLAMESGQMIDIPSRVPDSIQTFDEQYRDGLTNIIQDSILLSFIDSWVHLGGDVDMTYHQELDRSNWWIHIRNFPSFDRIAAIGLAMPEGSLKMGMIRNYSTVIIAIIFLLISILLYLIASARRRRPAPSVDANGDQKTDWLAVISGGENQFREFKSALRIDLNQGVVNPKLEDVIVKSIAAFSNGEGGLLLIGVADDGSIIGLESDFSSLKKQDSDYFEIHLRNLLKQQFGISFITTSMSIEFPVLEGKEICAITIMKGKEPVYMTTVDKNGNKTERFYVRSGNSSQEIQSLREITEYIGKRF